MQHNEDDLISAWGSDLANAATEFRPGDRAVRPRYNRRYHIADWFFCRLDYLGGRVSPSIHPRGMYHIWDKPRFPPPHEAGPDGLLVTGGSLSPPWLIEAYKSGIFPMPLCYERERIMAWFSPNPRGIFELDGFHVSRRLARRLARGEFTFSLDRAFARVVEGCASPRHKDTGCWLTLGMQNAYQALHQLGYAHSVEVWQDGELVGGVYGIAMGGFFAGESMFHRVTDASKAALWRLVEQLRERGYQLFDVQWTNDHTRSLGAIDIPREEYLRRLRTALRLPVTFCDGPAGSGP